MSYDAGDRDQVKRKQVRKKLDAQRDQEYLKTVLETYAGRACIWEILSLCRIYQISFTTDPLLTAFHEGHRQVGLSLYEKVLTTSERLYSLMRDEAEKRQKDDDE